MVPSPSVSKSHVYDPRRLEVLESTQLLDSGPEEAFDRLTRLAAQLVATPAAQVNLIDTRRQFFKSDYQRDAPSNGGGEVPLSQSFCQYVVAEQQPLIVEDARQHPVLCSNGSVLSGTVVSYVGVPLTTSDGLTLGSLCVFDTVPRTWPSAQVVLLRELAALVMTEIELRRTAKQLQGNYTELQKLELQRGELVNMLVHDLRNPLTSVLGGLDLIGTEIPAVRALGTSQRRRGRRPNGLPTVAHNLC
jgi:GAF domain-containing protein